MQNAECVEINNKNKIGHIIEQLNNNLIENIYNQIQDVTIDLISKNCYPLSDEKLNLTVYSHAMGYRYLMISALDDGFDGNIKNFIQILKALKARYAKTAEIASELIDLLLVREKNLKKIRAETNKLEKILLKITNSHKKIVGQNCTKIAIFLNFLRDLKAKSINISLYLIPKEIQIKDFKNEKNKLCTDAENLKLQCFDLVPYFAEHYSNYKNNSLFIDGNHLTVEGNKKVAEWILASQSEN